MRLYDYRPAPSPRRVRIFLAEKGVELETVQVDLADGEELRAPFRELNPRCVVPFLELDDGTGIGEAAVICRYLEARYPEPPLHGTTPEQRALIEMWDRAIEDDGFRAVAEAVRNTSPAFVDYAITGSTRYPQIPALAERGKQRTREFMDRLDARLAASPYVAGEGFTVADITALVCVDFARWAKVKPEPRHVHLLRWHAEVSARPSAAA